MPDETRSELTPEGERETLDAARAWFDAWGDYPGALSRARAALLPEFDAMTDALGYDRDARKSAPAVPPVARPECGTPPDCECGYPKGAHQFGTFCPTENARYRPAVAVKGDVSGARPEGEGDTLAFDTQLVDWLEARGVDRVYLNDGTELTCGLLSLRATLRNVGALRPSQAPSTPSGAPSELRDDIATVAGYITAHWPGLAGGTLPGGGHRHPVYLAAERLRARAGRPAREAGSEVTDG